MEPRKEQKNRFRIERLEERIAPSQLGQIVSLPRAPGADGAVAAPADHFRAALSPKKL